LAQILLIPSPASDRIRHDRQPQPTERFGKQGNERLVSTEMDEGRDKRERDLMPGESKPSVGGVLRVARLARGLTQEQLAQLAGIPEALLASVEADRVPLSLEHAAEIAHVLGCDPTALVLPGSTGRGDPAP
jgi:DNA-binding XRE family transcriptional regulator